MSIDANNKPGQRVTYDEFGRPKLWEKLDLTKATSHAEYAKKTMEKEYHLMDELFPGENLRIICPKDGETIYAGQTINIGLARGIIQSNCVEYKKTTDANWTLIYCDASGVANPVGYGYVAWTVPSALAGSEIQLRASDASGSLISIVDEIRIVNP